MSENNYEKGGEELTKLLKNYEDAIYIKDKLESVISNLVNRFEEKLMEVIKTSDHPDIPKDISATTLISF